MKKTFIVMSALAVLATSFAGCASTKSHAKDCCCEEKTEMKDCCKEEIVTFWSTYVNGL